MKAFFNHKLCRSRARSRKCISVITARKDRQRARTRKKERKKERNDRERESETEGGRDRGRGHTEPTGGGLRPESAPSHTQMSPHKYVLGVYVKEMNLRSYLHSCVCK